MPRTGLSQWSDIKSQFKQGLLLGNGASIVLYSGFNYKNLFNNARTNNFITHQVETVFNHFNTSDFEHVLNMVWHTHHLNMALKVKERKTALAYKRVREALIKTVRLIHPLYSDISLAQFADFLKGFQTLVSLNYDLLVYWAYMYANELDKTVTFKDCFVHKVFKSEWRELRAPILPSRRSVLVFYPHGNLALTTDLSNNERKVTVASTAN